jgi:dolichyl-phosphate-mannose-protein mannosyltransferase
MIHLARRTTIWLCVFLSCLGFVLAGWALIPYNGIESDEALLGDPIFGPVMGEYRIRISHRIIPLMLMDYVGALKSWLYWPIFGIFKPSPESLRLPVLIIGAVTIWLFYLLLSRIAGPRAAIGGAFLLASDTMFQLTTEFDWGPVAIQHLMLVTSCLLLLHFARTGSAKSLLGGFFALGLGLWDKALFAWIIGGLVVAVVVVFPKDVLRRLTVRNLSVALAGFLLGAWPLLAFNARHAWPTIRRNASLSAENVPQKAEILERTINGSGLFGFMVNDSSSLPPGVPESWLERASTGIADFTKEPQRNFLFPALLISLLTAPLWRSSRRAILFALVFMTAAWIQMALTKNAGGSVHHAVLLWPFPQFVVALAVAEASRRWTRRAQWGRVALGVAIAFLCITNLILTNEYLACLIRYGPAVTWTDAIYPLSNSLANETRDVIVMDWDIYDPLLLLHRGGANMRAAFFSMTDDAPGQEQKIESMLSNEPAVFVTHAPEIQFFPLANRKLESTAAALGYRKELLRTVADGHGRKVFEVYQFVKQ